MAEKTRDDICRGFYQHPGLEIQVGETQTLIPMEERFCPCGYVFRLNDGEIVAGGRRSGHPGIHSPDDPAPIWKRSKDGGQTWHDSPAWPTYNAYQFPDGEIIQLSSDWLQMTDQKGVYSVPLYRSQGDGNTNQEETVTLVDMPALAEREDRFGRQCAYAYIDHAIVSLSDGSLLASAHCQFVNNKKWHCFVIRSVDRGKTWSYRSTVAYELSEGDKPRMAGFTEPDLLVLPNGEILCFMRTGGGYDGQYTPLYMSRSADEGKTWSVADPIADRGVYPRACLTQSGVIAIIYGRPGHWLAFSIDQGHSWTGHFCLDHGPQPRDCGSYDWILEVAPDTLLAAYARTDPNDCMQSEILGTFITIKRT